jgi:hypothetical protein
MNVALMLEAIALPVSTATAVKEPSMLLRTLVLSSVLILAVAIRASAEIAPEISFEKDAVVASGVTPGGKVVWFSVAREISEHTATIVPRQQIVEDEGNDGTVRFELDGDVPFQSIWVAVDLKTGASAIGVPEGYPLRRYTVPAGNLRRGESKADWIAETRGYVEVLLVRPDKGAWWSPVGDGGIDDDDGVYDGHLVASLPRLEKVEGSTEQAPGSFAANDVVVIVDPNAMEVGLRQLTEVAK